MNCGEEITTKTMYENKSKHSKMTLKCKNIDGVTLSPRTSIYLWEFLLEILDDPNSSTIISWTDKTLGEFKLLNAEEVAKQWGLVKRRPNMDKIKMCRAMRYYYKKDIINKVKGKQYSYRFIKLPYYQPEWPPEITCCSPPP